MERKTAVDRAIEEICSAQLSEYPLSKYNTPYKRFKIIEDALMRMGKPAYILRATRDGRRKGKPVYMSSVDFIQKHYFTRSAAKNHIARCYLKLVANANKRTDIQEPDGEGTKEE